MRAKRGRDQHLTSDSRPRADRAAGHTSDRGARGGRRRLLRRSLTAALLATIVPVVVSHGTSQAAATNTVALYGMNEPAGSTVLTDSSGTGLHGTIGAEVVEGLVEGSTTFHRFPHLLPGAPPPTHPEHLDRVPDSPQLDPDAGDYSVTVRYRTTHNFGNIIQKGQNGTPGGYFKFEAPNGVVSCLFKGSMGEQRTATSVTSLADGQWHVVKCERTPTAVTMFVDGVQTSKLNGPTGTISNSKDLSIAGKATCDQIQITCDYFAGDIDYVRIEKGAGGAPNTLPHAAFTKSCTALSCTFSAAGSTDADGQIHAYSWNFGDGAKAIGVDAAHTYVTGGTYNVTLTVLDDRGGIDTKVQSVDVSGGGPVEISFVDKASATANSISHSVQLPPSVLAGDGLVLIFSENTDATMSAPTGGVTGWTSLGTSSGGFANTQAWRKVAAAGDGGKSVRIDLSKQSKGSLTLLVYRGTALTDPVAAFQSATTPVSSAARVTPVVAVADPRSWVVSFWMHGDSSTAALSVPGAVTKRASGTQTGGGRVTTLAADSNGPVPAGSYGGFTSNASAASTTTSTWTIVLAPRP